MKNFDAETQRRRGKIKQFPRYMVVILLVAAFLRLHGLDNLSPPGLEHDEVAHWLINRDILAGNHAIYFTEAYGHEAGYHYYQAAFMPLLGDNALALRLPSAFAGLLGLAVAFALIRRLFGTRAALFSAALLAVLFYPIFYSRLGLRAISLPLLSGLSAYFWWRGWQVKKVGSCLEQVPGTLRNSEVHHKDHQVPGTFALVLSMNQKVIHSRCTIWGYFALAGFFAGLSLHTYMAARAAPIFYALFAAYLFLVHRPNFRRRWRGIALFFAVYIVVALPLILYLLNNPTAEFRISEVDAPLRALREGNLQPVLENSLKIAGMFGIEGDPLWRQNVAGLPVFDRLTAVLFYAGLIIALWRWRRPRYAFLTLWLSTAAIPSIVTVDAPSSIRIVNILPILTVFPFISLRVIHSYSKLSTVSTGLSTARWGKLVPLLVFLILGLNFGRTTWNLFNIWPNNEEVEFVWQAAFTDMAAYLDSSGQSGPVAIGGWTPETMDPPSMHLLLRRDDLSLRHFDPAQSLILPSSPDELTLLLWPSVLPPAPELQQKLLSWGPATTIMTYFAVTPYQNLTIPPPQFPYEATFGEEVTFLGYDLIAPQTLLASGTHRLLSYWRVERPSAEPRRFFLHLVDETGQPIVQQDTLGVPAEHWREGDRIIQLHTLDIPPTDGPVSLLLGIYNPDTNQRLRTADNQDAVRLDN